MRIRNLSFAHNSTIGRATNQPRPKGVLVHLPLFASILFALLSGSRERAVGSELLGLTMEDVLADLSYGRA